MTLTPFERYGGFATIHKVVMAFYDKVLDSDIMAEYFEGVDMRNLIDHQTQFVSQIMGGPAAYTDEMIRQLHARLAIHDVAFDEMAELLEETLEDFEVEEDDIAAVMNEITTRRPLIVTAASPGEAPA